MPDLLTHAVSELGLPVGLAPIHRLDRGTSGVVLCSPDAGVRAAIGAHFAAGEVDKRYRALVFGRTHAKGIVRRPLGDRRRDKPMPAVTRYRTLELFPKVSLIGVRPQTGRRHQIRRHLSAIGHAIVGDERYPPKRRLTVPAFPGRLWLHAEQLRLPDGRRFEAPLPQELSGHLATLRERRDAKA